MLHVRAPLIIGLLLVVSGSLVACGDANRASVTGVAPAGEVSGARRSIVRIDDAGSPAQPIDAWMGDRVEGAARVRVVDANGQGIAGVAVRFVMDSDSVARDGDVATSRVVASGPDGVASVGALVLPVSDTVVRAHRVIARFADGGGDVVPFVLRAWRDLSRFGGSTPMVLDALPIDRRAVAAILPLGTFSTDDALPSPDALLMPASLGRFIVRAPAEGLITELDTAGGSVTIRVRDAVRLRIGGVEVQRALWVGRVVHAGDVIGTFAPVTERDGLAVRVLDGATQRTNWIRPGRYGSRRNVTFFARYLADSVRSEVFALVRRAAPDLAGRIDYDRGGRLVGTWFDASASTSSSASAASAATYAATMPLTPQMTAANAAELDPAAAAAPLAMSFVYDAERPGQIRVAIGSGLASALGLQGVRAVAWDDADPADVDVARGTLRYHLYATNDEVRMGRAERLLLVQLVDATTLRVELVSSTGGDTASFTTRALILVR